MSHGDDDGLRDDDGLCLEWIRDEALNLVKVFSGEKRLDFVEWKRRRYEIARTMKKADA